MSQDTGNDLVDEGIKPAQASSNLPTTSINEILEDFLNDYPANTPTKVWKPKRTNAELKSDFVTALYTLIASVRPKWGDMPDNYTADNMQGYKDAIQDYDNAIKELFNG